MPRHRIRGLFGFDFYQEASGTGLFYETWATDISFGQEKMRKGSMGKKGQTFKISLMLGVILIISLLHYLTQRQERYYHLFYRELYFLPLILAGIWFGLRGAILSSLFISLFYLPMVFNEWNGFSINDFDRILEIILLNIIAVILGFLSDREKKVLKSLQEAETLAALEAPFRALSMT